MSQYNMYQTSPTNTQSHLPIEWYHYHSQSFTKALAIAHNESIQIETWSLLLLIAASAVDVLDELIVIVISNIKGGLEWHYYY